jgi:hypothetical protein
MTQGTEENGFNDPVNMKAARAIDERVRSDIKAHLKDKPYWPEVERELRIPNWYNRAIEIIAKVRS